MVYVLLHDVFFRTLREGENGVVHDTSSLVLLLDKNITLGVTAFELQIVIISTAVSS